MVRTILVVDDDEVFRRRLSRAFTDRGFSVVEAGSRDEALTAMSRGLVSLSVLDLRIGKDSGLELLAELLKMDSLLRIVVLTGYGSIATAVEAVRLGAVNYLTKPIDADSVLSAFNLQSTHLSPIVQAVPVPRLEQVEWDHIQRVMSDCEGNISMASKLLGLHRRSLQRKLSKLPNRLR